MSKRKDEQSREGSDVGIEVSGAETKASERLLTSLKSDLEIEAGELGARRERLTAFIDTQAFSQLDRTEQERLRGQKTAMTHYHEILTARIAAQG